MKRIFGREPVLDELTGEGYLALVHPEDRPAIREKLFGSIRNGEPFALEHRLLRPDGAIRWIFVQGETRVSAGRAVARVSGTSLDITERKEAQLALEAEKFFIEKLTDASPDVITLYDLEQMRNLYSSREVYSILGYSEEELRQIQARGPEAFVEYFHPEDLLKVVTFLEEYKYYRGEAPREIEYRIKNAAGEWVCILDRYRVFRYNADGLPAQIMGVARDITERKRAEAEIDRKNRQLQEAYEEMAAAQEELRQTNARLFSLNHELESRVEARTRDLAAGAARLQLITDSLPVLISYVDNRQCYRFTNRTYGEWFGISPGHVLGKTVADVLGPEAYGKVKEYIDLVLGGEPVEFQTELDYPFAGRRVVSALYVPHLENNQVWGYYAMVSDVTQLQKTRQALEQALEESRVKNSQLDQSNRELTRINQDMDTFVYTASHDLRSPIANLTGLQRVLIKKLAGKTTPDEQELLELMNQGIGRLSRTIDVLTQVVRVQKEQQPFETMDIRQVLEEVKQDMPDLLEAARPEIKLDMKTGIVSFPRQYLRSIVYNLLSNALKYRSPQRRLEVKITTFREAGYTVFCVEDNGLGLAPGQTEKIFRMFRRMHTHVEGTGVGLYMVRQMLENYGGKIEAEGRPGEGMLFKVYFPDTDREADPASDPDGLNAVRALP
jgi:PAS domain S-box-containing protein